MIRVKELPTLVLIKSGTPMGPFLLNVMMTADLFVSHVLRTSTVYGAIDYNFSSSFVDEKFLAARLIRFAFVTNANCVPQHINEIHDILISNKLDILGLTETCLKPDTHFVDNRFIGYYIYRYDGISRGRDGYALIRGADLSVDLVSCSSSRLFQVRFDIPAEFSLFLVSPLYLDPILFY